MKSIIASLLALGSVVALCLVWERTASAESPERCILYAREYAIAAVAPAPPGSTPAHSRQSIQDAAYARCLNLGISALVPEGTTVSDKPLAKVVAPKPVVKIVAPRIVAKAPRHVAPVASVSAFTESDRASGGGSSQAIAEVFGLGGGQPSASTGLPVASSCGGGIPRTRFWRGLMTPSAGGGC